MADTENKNKISIATYGVGEDLDKMSDVTSDIVKQTTTEVANKFGKRLDNKVIDNYTNMNLSNLFTPTNKTSKGSEKKTGKVDSLEQFKNMMQDNSASAIQMLTSEQGRIMNYNNYKAIVDNIPECSMARDTYLANILSPDDYTKSIFIVKYHSSDDAEEKAVVSKIKRIIKKYDIENLITNIVSDTLVYGDCFVSVLPYDREISKYIAQTSTSNLLNESVRDDNGFKILNEAYKLDSRLFTTTLNEETILECANSEEREVLQEAFGDNANDIVSNIVNKNIQVRSVTDLLVSRAKADNDIIFSKDDVETDYDKAIKRKRTGKMNNLKINGSAIRKLEADRMVALEIDGVCYGYYYVEPGFSTNLDQPYNAMAARGYTNTSNPMNPTIQPQMVGVEKENASRPEAVNLNITDDKLNLITNVLLKALGKKLNKDYIEDNKQFKDLLFNLLKQKYLFEKGVSITYFLPEEVIHFKMKSIFEDIVFFAKVYLAILTNIVIIKMGRGHDKRIFYIATGVDNNYEQAIMKVVQDVKTKEFRMSSLGSITSILNLNPGSFDDFYMPQINGEKPVDIDVIQGMDQDINNDFLEFLRKSMIKGTGLPSAISETVDSIDFARQITAQNADLCRKVIMRQKELTNPSCDLIRTLFKYEYQYSLDKGDQIDNIDINDIDIQYPSPAALNLANLNDMFLNVETYADNIAKTYVPDTSDQLNADKQVAFKNEIVRNELSQINWEQYDELYKKFDADYTANNIKKRKKKPADDPGQGYDGY